MVSCRTTDLRSHFQNRYLMMCQTLVDLHARVGYGFLHFVNAKFTYIEMNEIKLLLATHQLFSTGCFGLSDMHHRCTGLLEE